MDPFSIVATGVVGTVLLVVAGHNLARVRLVRVLGLASDGWSAAEASGRLGGRVVRLRNLDRKEGAASLEVDVPELDGRLALGPRRVDSPAPAIGDPAFDRIFEVVAPGSGIGALDAHMRARLRGRARALEVRGGVARVPLGTLSEAFVRQVVELAADLAATDLDAAVVDLALHDPEPLVRATALAAMPEALRRGVVDRLLRARGPDLDFDRALCAIYARDPAVFAAAFREPVPTDQRQAVAALLARRPDEALVLAAIPVAARFDDRVVWRSVADAAERIATATVVRAFADATLSMPQDELAFLADCALGVLISSRDPAFEPEIVAFLPAADEARREALAWLEDRGTVAAVPTLDGLLARQWPLASITASIRAAKSAIQARAGGSRGELSVAEAGEGRLSPADPDGRGGLTAEEGARPR